jgi:prepilin-type N-terminal cleavage/methylation domain-containing protein
MHGMARHCPIKIAIAFAPSSGILPAGTRGTHVVFAKHVGGERMLTMTRLRRKGRGRNAASAGFTLIELLCVLTIIGVLSAIVIPRLLGIRATAYDARAKSDLRNAANAEEAYFVAVGDYLSCTDDNCKTQLPDFRLSNGVSIELSANNGAQPTFSGTATAMGGSKTFQYDSSAGGMIN